MDFAQQMHHPLLHLPNLADCPESYTTAAIGTADRISNRGNTQNLNRTANITVNLNGLSIGNVNSEDDIRKVMQRIAAETQKAVFVTGGGVK